MSAKQPLTEEQERMRLEGLRALARIIARHYLAHPEHYETPRPEGPCAPGAAEDAPEREGDAA